MRCEGPRRRTFAEHTCLKGSIPNILYFFVNLTFGSEQIPRNNHPPPARVKGGQHFLKMELMRKMGLGFIFDFSSAWLNSPFGDNWIKENS
jgi:hypothetical protein